MHKRQQFSTFQSYLKGRERRQFDSLDAIEKAAVEGALNRCRGLAAKIKSELCNKKPEHFVDKLALADFYAALGRAADVLGQRGRQSAPAVKDSQARAVSAR